MMKSERFAKILVIVLIVAVAAGVVVARLNSLRDAVELHGQMAEEGGWKPEVIHAQVGKPLQLRLISDDVVHGFAVGQTDHPAVDVEPGKMTELSLTFEEPGEYTFFCTRWCGLNHWRMRGTIEVAGQGSNLATPVSQPYYMSLNIDIDAPHPAASIPTGKPFATNKPTRVKLAENYLGADYYRSNAPAEVYSDLRADPAYATVSDAGIWELVATIWRANTTIQALSEGERLFAENCAACHGETGAGDGVFAKAVQSQFGKSTTDMNHSSGAPSDFTDPHSMLGASPALLQGKIVRGGMGTGMPYWGPVFTDRQTWDLVAYLYLFQFDYQELIP
jgi:cytochrome c oxidase subunit 2